MDNDRTDIATVNRKSNSQEMQGKHSDNYCTDLESNVFPHPAQLITVKIPGFFLVKRHRLAVFMWRSLHCKQTAFSYTDIFIT